MKRIKRIVILVVLLTLTRVSVFADEGMWLPQLLQTLNQADMKKAGMKMNASDIYNISKSSLKDAIVSFGGFCTAEVISGKGLILTNHHCGFDQIQNHSSLQSNYIRDGFWARDHAQELPNPGLTATFIIRIDDVTAAVLKGVPATISEKERQSLIDRNIAEVRKTTKKESWQETLVRPFFEGNRYYLFVTEVFRDVRLVGAPPSSIGNFGKDTDNWMWPRHTGDFSLFRIYADKNNRPASFSKDNVPYKPKRSLNISLDGVTENDFTMVFGFPARTSEYLHSAAIEQIVNVNDPAKVGIRKQALGILDEFMRKDEQVRIQYAAKYASVSNAYKKWQGEILGLTKKNAVARKKAYEAEFQKRVDAKPEWKSKYGTLLQQLEEVYRQMEPVGLARDYHTEIVARIELFTIARHLHTLVTASDAPAFATARQKAANSLEEVYRELDVEVDRRLFSVMMDMYIKQQGATVTPALATLLKRNNNDINAAASEIYGQTILTDAAKVGRVLQEDQQAAVNLIRSDVGYQLYTDVLDFYNTNTSAPLNTLQATINVLQRQYMAAQMEVFKEKKFYPDANGTLRVTYGQAKGYEPKDAVKYGMYTYLDGVIEKYIPGDYEFDLPSKLIDLYNKKDFGRYGVNGMQPVCFIAANHTTGGNSGSPALDAHGNLVGLNFDRVWEGTMSDLYYDKDICRNIMVDIRYVAFIIDKFANASNIISEMNFVHPKKGKK